MAALNRVDVAKIDLDNPLLRSYAGKILATGDDLAHRYGVEVYRGKQAVSMDGYGVTGYFIRSDDSTVLIVGATSGNVAYVDLPDECYAYEGRFSLAIKISGNDCTRTVRIIDGAISLTQTDAVIDPGETIPSLDDLFAQIAAMEAATADAKTATEATKQATSDVLASAQTISESAAPAIIPTATGDIITVGDSANRPLAGLRLYGKTTQDGTPTPSAPVPLVNVGAGGNIGVKAQGKNLLQNNASTQTKNGVTFTVNDDGSVTINGTATANTTVSIAGTSSNYSYHLPAGDFIISGCTGGATDTYFLKLRSEAKNPVAESKKGEERFTHDGTALWCYIYVYSGVTVNETIYPMIRPAPMIDATFEPYKDGGSVTASTPNGLPGIPVSSGGNYTDENGQQWICDEIIWPEMTYVQRVVKLTGFTKQNSLEATDIYVAPAGNTLRGKSENIGLCNVTNSYGYNEFDNTHFYVSATTCVVYVPKGFSGSIEALVALAEPIETAAELVIYQDLASKYPSTTILNDGGAGMKASYVADTKNYIDQRIAAMLSSN